MRAREQPRGALVDTSCRHLISGGRDRRDHRRPAPHRTRPFRRHIDPAGYGAELVDAVADRIRAEFSMRVDLVRPARPPRAE
jgi:hypothetical protein